MNAKEYYAKHGKDKVEEIAIEAKTTLAYFRHLTTGYRYPSRKLALRLEKASGGEMSAAKLILGNLEH